MEQLTKFSGDVANLADTVTAASPIVAIGGWIATTEAAMGRLFMAMNNSYPAGGAVLLTLNGDESGLMFAGAFQANSLAFRVKGNNGEYHKAAFANAALFDGGLHHILCVFNAGVAAMYLDGAAQSLAEIATANPVNGITLDFMGFGEVGGTILEEVTAKIGEFFMLDRVPTAAEIAALVAGFSPRFLDPPPLWHWSAVHGDVRDSFRPTDWFSAAPTLVHPAIIEPTAARDEHRADMRAHYELFVKPGTPADPNIDMPILRLPRAARTASVVGFGYTPNTTHWASIWARNEVGRALTGPAVSFPVDGGGNPVITPAAVTEVTAIPTAGGHVLVGWHYDEQNTIAVAARFEIEAVAIDVVGQAPVTLEVTHIQPRNVYAAQIGPLLDGLWYVRVRSISASGARREQVSGVFVRPDSTPPVTSAEALEAV